MNHVAIIAIAADQTMRLAKVLPANADADQVIAAAGFHNGHAIRTADDIAEHLKEPEMRQLSAHVTALHELSTTDDAGKPEAIDAKIADLMSGDGPFSSAKRSKDKKAAAKKCFAVLEALVSPALLRKPKAKKEKPDDAKEKDNGPKGLAVLIRNGHDEAGDPCRRLVGAFKRASAAVKQAAVSPDLEVMTETSETLPNALADFNVPTFSALFDAAIEATKVNARAKREPKEPRKPVELGAGGHRAGTMKEQARQLYDEAKAANAEHAAKIAAGEIAEGTPEPRPRKQVIADIEALGAKPSTAATWFGFFGSGVKINERTKNANARAAGAGA